MKFKLIFLKAEGLSKVCIVFGLNSTFFSKRTYNQSTFFFLWNRSTNQHEITSLMRLKDTFSNLSSCLDIAAHIHSQESYNNLIQAKQIHNYPKVCQETDRRCRGKSFSDDILGFFLVQIGNSAPKFRSTSNFGHSFERLLRWKENSGSNQVKWCSLPNGAVRWMRAHSWTPLPYHPRENT